MFSRTSFALCFLVLFTFLVASLAFAADKEASANAKVLNDPAQLRFSDQDARSFETAHLHLGRNLWGLTNAKQLFVKLAKHSPELLQDYQEIVQLVEIIVNSRASTDTNSSVKPQRAILLYWNTTALIEKIIVLRQKLDSSVNNITASENKLAAEYELRSWISGSNYTSLLEGFISVSLLINRVKGQPPEFIEALLAFTHSPLMFEDLLRGQLNEPNLQAKFLAHTLLLDRAFSFDQEAVYKDNDKTSERNEIGAQLSKFLSQKDLAYQRPYEFRLGMTAAYHIVRAGYRGDELIEVLRENMHKRSNPIQTAIAVSAMAYTGKNIFETLQELTRLQIELQGWEAYLPSVHLVEQAIRHIMTQAGPDTKTFLQEYSVWVTRNACAALLKTMTTQVPDRLER